MTAIGAIWPCNACSSTVAPYWSSCTEKLAWLSPKSDGLLAFWTLITNFGPVASGAGVLAAGADPSEVS